MLEDNIEVSYIIFKVLEVMIIIILGWGLFMFSLQEIETLLFQVLYILLILSMILTGVYVWLRYPEFN